METIIYNVVTNPHSDKQNVDNHEASPPKMILIITVKYCLEA